MNESDNFQREKMKEREEKKSSVQIVDNKVLDG
jgi:hypothetical protein